MMMKWQILKLVQYKSVLYTDLDVDLSVSKKIVTIDVIKRIKKFEKNPRCHIKAKADGSSLINGHLQEKFSPNFSRFERRLSFKNFPTQKKKFFHQIHWVFVHFPCRLPAGSGANSTICWMSSRASETCRKFFTK